MPKLILVVEDDPTIQRMLQTRLRQEGFEVASANNGLEGLEQIKKRKPELIISDVMMPVMDGFHFYQEIKKNKATADIPVLIITSYAETQDSFLLIGVDGFIAKPFDLAQLLYKARQLISGLKVQSVKIPKDDKGTIRIAKPKDPRMCVLSADISDLTQEMTALLDKHNYHFSVAGSGQDILENAALLNPRVILINVQIKNTPAVEIVNALNEFQGLVSQILVYSYFINEDLARDSDLDYFYTTNIDSIAKKSKLPVAYLGAFSKNVSKEHLIKAIEKYL